MSEPALITHAHNEKRARCWSLSNSGADSVKREAKHRKLKPDWKRM